MFLNIKKLAVPVFLLLAFTTLLHFISEKASSQIILKGGIRSVVGKGKTIEVKINTPVNFYFSQIGDNVAAFLSEDLYLEEDFYLPKGSRIEGVITNIKSPKRFGQSGAFEIDFNEIVTPSDIHIPIYASVSTDTSTKFEKAADILTYDSALIAYGTFHGAVAGIQYGGIPLAITSHGISVLASAGVGLGAGLAGSILRKGEIPTITLPIRIPLLLKSDFYILGELPEMQEAEKQEVKSKEYKGFRFFPKAKKEEIELAVKNIKKEHSDKYGNYLVIEFYIKNNSYKKISLSDISLISTKNEEFLHPDLFLSRQEVLKTIYPNEDLNTSLAFLISNTSNNYSLALIDPLDNEEIVRVPLKE